MRYKKVLNIGFRYTRRFLELFLMFMFFYLIIVLYGESIAVGELKDEGEVYIYVQSNGVHTDVCLPVHSKDMDWSSFIPQDAYNPDGEFEFVSIGWGDKGFFLDTPTWADLKTSTALNAAFLPSSTAMHVAYTEEPKETDDRKKVYLSRKNYKRLIAFVKSSFRLKNGRVDLIEGKGYTSHDNFYEAHNSYHMFRTCNRWTNQALKSANVRTGIFALFPNGILGHLK